ncbi:MAG: phosphatase PAP2 family protein [Patescibacteria group bacterium]
MNKIFLLILFLFAKSIYVVLNKRKSKYYWKIKFDDSIPLIPIFVIPYIGFYIYIVTTIIFLWNTKYINNFFITYIIAYILAGLFWYFIPNGVKRPIIKNKNIFSKLATFIHKADNDTNGFPSAHVFATLICSYFLSLVFPEYSILIWSVNFFICISTVFVKQHYVLDILGGIITFWLSLMISGLFLSIILMCFI